MFIYPRSGHQHRARFESTTVTHKTLKKVADIKIRCPFYKSVCGYFFFNKCCNLFCYIIQSVIQIEYCFCSCLFLAYLQNSILLFRVEAFLQISQTFAISTASSNSHHIRACRLKRSGVPLLRKVHLVHARAKRFVTVINAGDRGWDAIRSYFQVVSSPTLLGGSSLRGDSVIIRLHDVNDRYHLGCSRFG